MDDKLLIQLSAFADGELDGAARRELDQKLAGDPELAREAELFRKLDKAAAGLPVPQYPSDAKHIHDLAARTTGADRDVERRLDDAAAQLAVPEISAARFDAAWQKIAARTVKPSTRDEQEMQFSALFDGETGVQPSGISDTELETLSKVWSLLDDRAAALPTPQMEEFAARETFRAIAERTTDLSSTDRRAFKRIDAETAKLPVPELDDAKSEAAWSAIAERTVGATIKGVGAVPDVSEKKWDGVWSGIQNRIAAKETAAATPHPPIAPAKAKGEQKEPIVTIADFRPAKRWHPWRWVVAASMAATVLLAVVFTRHPEPPAEVAVLEVPEVLDNRYRVHVKYVEGQSEPVVCFFLKSDPAANDSTGK